MKQLSLNDQKSYMAMQNAIINTLDMSHAAGGDLGKFVRFQTIDEWYDSNEPNRIFTELLDGMVVHHVIVAQSSPMMAQGADVRWRLRFSRSEIALSLYTQGMRHASFHAASTISNLVNVIGMFDGRDTLVLTHQQYLDIVSKDFWEVCVDKYGETERNLLLDEHIDGCDKYRYDLENADIPFNRAALMYVLSHKPDVMRYAGYHSSQRLTWITGNYAHYLPDIISVEGCFNINGADGKEYAAAVSADSDIAAAIIEVMTALDTHTTSEETQNEKADRVVAMTSSRCVVEKMSPYVRRLLVKEMESENSSIDKHIKSTVNDSVELFYSKDCNLAIVAI